MSKICLDLSFLLAYLSGEESAVRKIRQEYKEVLYISALTMADLGLILQDATLIDYVREAFEVLAFDERAALLTREVFDEMERAGRKAKERVAMEAAVCMANNAYVLTKKKALYEGISGLRVII